MRDSSTRRRPRNYLARNEQARLLILVLGLGLVIALMVQVRQAESVRALAVMFGLDAGVGGENPPRNSAAGRPADSGPPVTPHEIQQLLNTPAGPPRHADEVRIVARENSPQSAPTENSALLPPELFANVVDNDQFRTAESTAWNYILRSLASADAGQLSEQASGDVSYVQLLRQPNAYRGRLLKIRGDIRQQITVSAPKSAGVEKIYRLVLKPAGGTWPVLLYCLEMPTGFPQREELREPVMAVGYFFKNLSYAAQRDLSVAPVLICKSIDWARPARTPRQATAARQRSFLGGVCLAGAIATLVVWIIWRRTFAPRRGMRRNGDLPDADFSSWPLT